MSHYISLFEHWNKVLKTDSSSDQFLEETIKEIKLVHKYISNVLFIQDYRDFGIRYVTDNVYAMTGYYPENIYSGGIEMGLNLLHPDDLSDVLVLQKKAFDFIQRVPESLRFSIEIRYCGRIRNRLNNKYQYIHTVITPLLFDDRGNVVLDISNWQFANPVLPSHNFQWSLSYIAKTGQRIEERSRCDNINLNVLSAAENKVFYELLKGYTSKIIGEKLHLSKNTIDTHRRKILNKLNLSSTSQLISIYAGSGNAE